MRVLGSPSDKQVWRGAIVIQGPYYKIQTERSVREFLERNPQDILVILSSYTSELSEFELRQLNDPSAKFFGRFICIICVTPELKSEPDFWRTNHINQNLQRLTTFTGLKYAKELEIAVVLKIRSDAFLALKDCCQFLLEQIKKYPIIHDVEDTEQIGRIVINDMCAISTPKDTDNLGKYFITDVWSFGYIQDIMRYFDMREGSFWNRGKGITINTAPESNLGLCWKNEMKLREEMTFQEILARYFVVTERNDVLFFWSRNHDYDSFMREGAHEYLTRLPLHWDTRRVTHERWRLDMKQMECLSKEP